MRNRIFIVIFTFLFIQISLSQISGPLRKHATNPRYFADANGNVVYLTGSHTWSNFQDNGNGNPPPVFDWIGYIEWMKSLNHNFMRLWTWEETRWTSETADTNYWFYPQTPYKRTGPGTALDGLPKFNLDSLNDSYFDRMRTRVIEAGQRGIYVSIMLFDGWSVSNRLGFHQPFDGCPFRLSNNINGVNGDADNDGDGEETHSLLDPNVNAFQYSYVKKVIDAVNDLDNVLYEISNESPYAGSDEWQKRMVDTIHAYELRKPKQHPVGYTGDWTIVNSDLWASNADWVSPGAGNNGSAYQNDPPASDGSKVVITDSDHLWGVGGNRIWVWKSFTRGLNPIFMDGYDGKSYGCGGVNFDSSNATWISFRKNMGYTRTFASRMNLAAMTPQNTLSSTTYCLANPAPTGAEYIIYRPTTSGSFTVNLASTSGNLNVEWFNPATGVSTISGTITGGTTQTFDAPFSGDAVLYLSSVGNGPLPTGMFQANTTTLPAGGGSVTLSWTSSGATYADIDQGIGSVATNGNIVVNISSTITYTLRLYNSNGTTLLPVTISVNAPPPPSGNIIYTENALTSPWNDIRSWSATRNYAYTNTVYQGTTSARIVHSPWASLQFSQGNWGSFVNINPNLYQSLDFVVNGGTTSFTLRVSCVNSSGGNILTPVSFTVPANSWLVKSIPMSQLAGVPFIAIQFTANGSNVTFYLDNIALVLKPAGPLTPVLSSPANNAVNQSTVPVLRWNTSSGAVTYHVQLSQDSLFTSLLINDSTLTDTSKSISGLSNSTNYFWRVRAKNALGTSVYSSTWKFSTIIAVPLTPQLVSPADSSANQTTPQSFRWNSVQNATSYRLQISSNAVFSSTVIDDSTLTDTARSVSVLQPLTQYYWRVNSKNIAGSSAYSTSRLLTTAIAAPTIPVLAFPTDNATSQSINPILAWYRVSNAISYRLQLSQDSTFVTVLQDQIGITDTTVVLSSLSNLVKYFWRINASNDGGSSSYSSIWRFTTIAPAPLPPQLVSPSNGVVNQPISFVFRWKKSANTSLYRIQVSTDSLFTSIALDDSTLTDTSRSISSLQYSTKYYWHVRATGVGGTSANSSFFSLMTGLIPSVPVLVTPFNSAVDQSIPLTLRWNSSSGASSYHVQVSTDSLFGTTIINDSTLVDTSRILSSLNNSTSYYWRVRAKNSIGVSSFSSYWKFTTLSPAAPTVNYIYQENSLTSPWNDIRSWSVTRNYASTNPVYQGTKSARIVHSPWAALQFSQGNWGSFVNINYSLYQSLDFAVHGGTSGVTLYVSCLRPSGSNIFSPVSFTVPANTWQVKSIPMSQLANTQFIAIYFTAQGSNVTFSLDNIGLVYNQGSAPASKSVPYHTILADLSNDGRVDGQDLFLFTEAITQHNLSVADIGPAEGSAPLFTKISDGKIDEKDFKVFSEQWKWSNLNQTNIQALTDVEGKNSLGNESINLTSKSGITSLKNQRFALQLPAYDEIQTVEFSITYAPSSIRIDNIFTENTGELYFLKNINNITGHAVVAVASSASTISKEMLSSGMFDIELTRLSTNTNDSIRVDVQSYSTISGSDNHVLKTLSIQKLFVPQTYGLDQNYPNPFNPATTIRYLLPVKSHVVIEVYNTLGQSVAQLVNNEVDAGIRETVWNAGVSSGIYFYRMVAVSSSAPSKRFVLTKKMVLLK